MDKQLISSGAAFEERVGYSRAVRVGDRVWVSGTAPIMPGDADPPTGPYEQAVVCLAIIERALVEAGSSLDQPVKTTVFLQNLDDFAGMNEVYARHVGETPPARSTVEVAKLPSGALVEIEAVALL